MRLIDERIGEERTSGFSTEEIAAYAQDCERRMCGMTRFRVESAGYGASEDVMKYSPRCHTLTVRTSSSTFLVRELVDLASVSSKLTQRALSIHTYVWDRLSVVTQNLLMQCGGSTSDADLKAALVEDFNTIICGQLIYDYQRFSGVNVEHDTVQLLEPGGDTRW
jgi:hypothetical protein